MALTKKHIDDFCLVHQGHNSCRYLIYDMPSGTYLCTKLHPNLKAIKDDAVAFNEREAGRVNLPVIDYFNLHGIGHKDNCSGYFYMKNIQQGYDVP